MGNYKHGELISRGGFDIVHGCQLRCIGRPNSRNLLVPKKICRYMDTSDQYKFYVDYDGIVVPCCNRSQAFVLGNLKEKRKQKLYKMKTSRKGMPICGQCEKS